MEGRKFDCIAFFYRVFFLQRRTILRYWHTRKAKAEYARLSDEFYTFVRVILYEPVSFHMLNDYMLVFGPALPIRYTFFTQNEDKKFILNLFADRQTAFKVRKEHDSNTFDYSQLTFINDNELVDLPTRRALLREFVWMCCETKESHILVELIAALQRVLVSREGKGDVFVGAIHQAIQGRCVVNEVVCWDNSPYDEYPKI